MNIINFYPIKSMVLEQLEPCKDNAEKAAMRAAGFMIDNERRASAQARAENLVLKHIIDVINTNPSGWYQAINQELSLYKKPSAQTVELRA